MKTKLEKEEPEYKKGITIDTNPHQILAIIVIFLAMFVLPVEAYTLYKSSKETKPTATYTGEVQGVSSNKSSGNASSDGSVLSAVDSIIPSSLKTASSKTATFILYGGITSLVLTLIVLAALLIKRA